MTRRIILLIPKVVYDKIKVQNIELILDKYVNSEIKNKILDEYLLKLIHNQSIPYMSLIENPNFYIGRMDRCCPCQCDDRYENFKVRKDEIDNFINTQIQIGDNQFIVFSDINQN